METLYFDLSQRLGVFKPLNATNGGPWCKRHAADQKRSNFMDYKAARIPYSRNHDSAMHAVYGGPYSHDITCIFPRFEADVNDPASYDFACTDESILICLEAGTKTFFRLGQTIENQIKKHATLPPVDFQKWAEICEHIIRHYTEGWADGFYLDMEYWEIWNEPDLDENSSNKRTWGGTKAQFFDFYEIAAKHLKSKFPHLKIGGPAVSGSNMAWAADFLAEMKRREVPIDFFSWHVYAKNPEKILDFCETVKGLLLENGYEHAESILNEWNYVKGWEDEFLYSVMSIHGLKNASFILSAYAVCQRAPLDMLMYYDTRPSAFCGIFDFYSYRPLKGYYPMKWYGSFYDLAAEVRSGNEIDNIYSVCGVDAEGKALCMLTYYSDDDGAVPKEIAIDFGGGRTFEVYLLDDEHDGTLIGTTGQPRLSLSVHACVLIKEIS